MAFELIEACKPHLLDFSKDEDEWEFYGEYEFYEAFKPDNSDGWAPVVFSSRKITGNR